MGCEQTNDDGKLIKIENLREEYEVNASLSVPEQFANCKKDREFDLDFFMIINCARVNPRFLANKLKLFESSQYCKDH